MPPTWANNLVADNRANYVGVTNQTGINGNLSTAPVFACPDTRDFHFLAGSPGIDAGTNSVAHLPTTDFDGRPRVIAAQSNAPAVVDIGAFEFDPLTPVKSCAPPILSCPEGFVTECGAAATLTVQAGQSNGDALIVRWKLNESNVQENFVPPHQFPFSTNISLITAFPVGTNIVEVTVTDSTTNVSCSTMVVVVDTVPPAIECPRNRLVDLTSKEGALLSFTMTATDLCSGTVDLSCEPPSGSIFPIGTTLVTCVATDVSSNAASCSFEATVLGALSIKTAVLEEMEALKSATQGDRRPALNKAISRLRRSIAANRWLDETHLKRSKAGGVFWNEAAAVRHLKRLLGAERDGIPDGTLQQWIDRLVIADRTLADLAIAEAIEAGVEPKKIRLTSGELSAGDLAGNRRHSVQAILLYRDAWRTAVRASARVQTP
jgi:hypothetical protein